MRKPAHHPWGDGADRSLRVCMLVGSLEEQHCGVKDYARRLAEELSKVGVFVEVHAPADESLASFRGLLDAIRRGNFDLVHVQYPSLGFRYALYPHLVGRTGVTPAACVTLHEYSSLPLPQRLSLHLFRWSTRAIVFTTTEEMRLFESLGGESGAEHLCIPIGSNVPTAPTTAVQEATVLYFGQIRPNKGIEAFLELAGLSLARGQGVRFRIMGASLPRHRRYLDAIQAMAPRDVEWQLGASLETVALQMASSLAAYLPFPDGASFRRGSLLAALSNHLPVISPVTAATPPELARVLLAAENPEQAFAQIASLLASPALVAQVRDRSRSLAHAISWPGIAERHRAMYLDLCSRS